MSFGTSLGGQIQEALTLHETALDDSHGQRLETGTKTEQNRPQVVLTGLGYSARISR